MATDGSPDVRLAIACAASTGAAGVSFEVEQSGSSQLKQLRARKATDVSADVICHSFLGPTSSGQDASGLMAPLVDGFVQGKNCALILFGLDTTAKMAFLKGSENGTVGGAAHGPLALAGQRLFEHVDEMSANGDVCIVEASGLEIGQMNGELTDLSANTSKGLSVAQDPLNPRAFTCEGLRRSSTDTPKALADSLATAVQRHVAKKDEVRAHMLLTVHFESLSIGEDMDKPNEVKGKLVIVDFAGDISEALARNGSDEPKVGLAALGLTSPVQAGAGSLAKLLVDIVGGGSQLQLVGLASAEAADSDATFATFDLARHILTGVGIPQPAALGQVTSRRPMPSLPAEAVPGTPQLNKPASPQFKSGGSPQPTSTDMPSSSSRQGSKTPQQDSQQLDDKIRNAWGESTRNIDAVKEDLLLQLQEDMAKTQTASWNSVKQLQQAIEISVEQAHGQKHVKLVQETAELGLLEEKLHEALTSKKKALSYAMDLRSRVAIMEERVSWLQDQEQDLMQHRPDMDQQRKQLHEKAAEQGEKIAKAELELQKVRAVVEVKREELSRLSADAARQRQAMEAEKAEQQRHSMKLTQEVQDLRKQLEVAKSAGRRETERIAASWEPTIADLREQVLRLQRAAGAQEAEVSELEGNLASAQEELDSIEKSNRELEEHNGAQYSKYLEEKQRLSANERELVAQLDSLHEVAAHHVELQEEIGNRQYEEKAAVMAEIFAIVGKTSEPSSGV